MRCSVCGAAVGEAASACVRARLAACARRLDDWLARGSRGFAWAGLVGAIAWALLGTADLQYGGPEYYRKEMAIREDMYRIYTAASRATWRDAARWWVGPWIYTGVGYYRPVTSMLFFAEQRLFDRRFNSYNRVTWVVHGLNAGLVYLLTLSLLHRRRRLRVLLGLLAAAAFTDVRGPFGFAIPAVLQWWPAQNDPLSAMFGLACLVLLDQHLRTRRPQWLAWSVAALAAAIGAKEMGHAAAAMAVLLIWRRRGRPAPAMAPFVLTSMGLYLLRLAVVPNPWMLYPTWRMVRSKILVHWLDPIGMQAVRGEWWPGVAAALVVGVFALGLRRRWPWRVVAPACAAAAGLSAQALGGEGGWALLLVPGGIGAFWGDLMLFASLALLWTCRRKEPAGPVLAFYLLAFASILGVIGTYYYYWAAAFHAILVAVVAACGVDLAREACAARWGAGPWSGSEQIEGGAASS